MTDAPTLFDQLAARDFTMPHPAEARKLCQADLDLIDVWNDVGIPSDLSTVEHACELLILLWRERATWLAIADELAPEAT